MFEALYCKLRQKPHRPPPPVQSPVIPVILGDLRRTSTHMIWAPYILLLIDNIILLIENIILLIENFIPHNPNSSIIHDKDELPVHMLEDNSPPAVVGGGHVVPHHLRICHVLGHGGAADVDSAGGGSCCRDVTLTL